MKIVYKKFSCPVCGHERWLKINGICVDCRDKIILNKIAQTRKMNSLLNVKTTI